MTPAEARIEIAVQANRVLQYAMEQYAKNAYNDPQPISSFKDCMEAIERLRDMALLLPDVSRENGLYEIDYLEDILRKPVSDARKQKQDTFEAILNVLLATGGIYEED